MRIKNLRIKNNSGKKAKRNALVLGVVSVAVLVAFIIRTFSGVANEIGKLTGSDPGMIMTWADHILGFGVTILLTYSGFILIANPILGITVAGAGLVVGYLTLQKLLGRE